MHEAAQIAAQLPSTDYLLSVCNDRFDFALGLVGAWMIGIPTLLPSDQGRAQLAELCRTYPSIHRLGDRELQAYRGQSQDQLHRFDGFEEKLGQTIVIPFTSGTTGDPVPYPKTLSSLMGSAALISRQLGGVQGIRLVATVPPQHMYGLELTLLLPLFEGAILDYRRPFFQPIFFQPSAMAQVRWLWSPHPFIFEHYFLCRMKIYPRSNSLSPRLHHYPWS